MQGGGSHAQSWAARRARSRVPPHGWPFEPRPLAERGNCGLKPTLKNRAVLWCLVTSAEFTRGGAGGRGKWERGGEPCYVERVLQPSFLRPRAEGI